MLSSSGTRLLRRAGKCLIPLAEKTRLPAVALVTRRSFSESNGDLSQIADDALQLSFEGFLPRLSSLKNLLDADGKKEYNDLVNGGIISNGLNGLLTYTDLQNPLLRKYKFDAADFLEGAKEAFRQVNLALASAEFQQYANNIISLSPHDDLLKSALNQP